MTIAKSTLTQIRRHLPLVGGGLAVAGVVGAVALSPLSVADSADLVVQPKTPASSTAPVANGKPEALIYSGGNYSVQLTVVNNTGHTMTFAGGGSPSTGHWAQRPTATINNTESNTISAYTNELGGFDWKLRWNMDNGDYACVQLSSGRVTNANPSEISALVSTDLDDYLDCKTPDPSFEGGSEQHSGGAHSWVTVDFGS